MGTIADKLSYLNTTKGKIKDSINLTGANIGNNDTFRSYSAKLRDSLVDIINNGTDELYDNFPKTTGTGSEIELDNTYEAPMGIDLKGNTFQQSYSGKNLCNALIYQNSSNNGIDFSNNGDGGIKVVGTATGLAIAKIQIPFTLISGTTYYINGGKSVNVSVDIRDNNLTTYGTRSTGENVEGEYTPSSDMSNMYACIRIASGETINTVIYPMVSTISGNEYEPYVGGTASPNPDYPQNVEVVTGNNSVNICGKNLFDKDNMPYIKAWLGSNGNINSHNTIKCYYMSCESNTNYTMSKKAGKYFRVAITSGIPVAGNTTLQTIVNDTGTNTTITATSSAKYLLFNVYDSSQDTLSEQEILDSVQLEQGSTPTTYEPYQSQSYEINLGKNLLDEIEIGDINTATGNNQETTAYSRTKNYIKVRPNSNISIQYSDENLSNYQIVVYEYDKNKNYIQFSFVNLNKYNLNLSENTNYIRVRFRGLDPITLSEIENAQIEYGQLTSYSPYKTPIELCKIDTYQDYIYKNNDKWYLHKEIGKYVYNNEGTINNRVTNHYNLNNISLSNYNVLGTDYYLSTNYKAVPIYDSDSMFTNNTQNESFCFGLHRNKSTIRFKDTRGLSADDFGSSLVGCIFYYVLDNSTDTEITDEELISQLNAIEKAMSYKDKTYITAKYIEGNQPFKIVASALLREE